MENNGTHIKRKTLNGVTIKLSSGDVELRKAFVFVLKPEVQEQRYYRAAVVCHTVVLETKLS